MEEIEDHHAVFRSPIALGLAQVRRRKIRRRLRRDGAENALALELLEGRFVEGDTVRAYADRGAIRFTTAETDEDAVVDAGAATTDDEHTTADVA